MTISKDGDYTIVTENDVELYRSKDATKAIQWALDVCVKRTA